MKKAIVLSALILGLASPAIGSEIAVDTADEDAVMTFAEAVYPRISSFSPGQDISSLDKYLRFFASDAAYEAYRSSLEDSGTLDTAFRKSGIVVTEIISKISTREVDEGAWSAEFVSRTKTFLQDSETSNCTSVVMSFTEMPLALGMNAIGVADIKTSASRVKCPS